MNEEEKLMGVYQTLTYICTICGKAIPTNTNPEIMSFVCDECLRPDFSTYIDLESYLHKDFRKEGSI